MRIPSANTSHGSAIPGKFGHARFAAAIGKLVQELAQRITIPMSITVYVGTVHQALGKAAAALPGGTLV